MHCNDPDCAEDVTGPTATIDLAPGQDALTNTAPVRFSIEFDEPVTDFDATDLTIGGTSGATAATLTGSGTSYTASIDTIPNDGTITIDLPAGLVTDAVGNASRPTIMSATNITFDATPPTIDLPDPIDTVTAPGATTAVVDYSTTATCTPPPGSEFDIGTTTVTCTATDDAGNTATETFTVTVAGISDTTTTSAAPTTSQAPTTSAAPADDLPDTGTTHTPLVMAAAALLGLGAALTAMTRRDYSASRNSRSR